MGRPARRLTGLVGLLSAALVFVASPPIGAAQQTASATQAATKAVGAAAAKSKVTARPLSAKAAKAAAAAEVDLPRPVHGETAVRLLGDDVDEAAALSEMTADDLVELLHSDASAWVDSEGAVFYKDAAVPVAPAGRAAAASASLDQTFTLHSKSDSQHTIFLDFDGASVSGSRWQTDYPGVPTAQPAWDPSGNGAAFDESELTSIQAVWASVAEDYAPFDVDVTTADPGADAINRSGSGDDVFGSHVVISPSAATSAAICDSQCGGAAYLNAFGATAGGDGYEQPAWVFPDLLGPDSPKAIAEAASHEVGHQLGLVHDGNATSDLDSGHGAWAPIMGVGELHPISQWSKGDYPDATSQEDEVATIRSVLGPRIDVAGSTVGQAAPFPTGTGHITSRTDVDVYLLGACTGTFSVSASPVAAQADLDIKLTLLSATGTSLTTADPASAQTSSTTASGMDASITQTNAAGTYYVAVEGTGNGPWTTGYDDYGSMGAYTMSQTGDCNGASPTGVPSKVNGLAATADPLLANVALSWTAPTNAGSGGAVSGYLLTRSGSDDYVQVPASTTSYTWTGLTFDSGYTFTVTPLNAGGAGAAASVPIVTSTGIVEPGAPRAVTAAWSPVPQTAVVAWSAPRSVGSAPVQLYALYLDGALYNYYSPSTTALQFAGLSPGGTYAFGVAAVSSAGTGLVTTATVAVPARAGNDDFAQRATISGVSGTIGGDNTESSEESGEPAPTAIRAGAGKASVWYSWTAPASGPVTMTTTSPTTGRDTTLDVYTGTSAGTLTRVEGNDDPAVGRLAAVTFDATAGATYAVGVNGYRTSASGVGSFSLSWAGSAIGPKSTTTSLTTAGSARSVKLTAAVTASFGAPVGRVYFYDGATQVGDDFLNSSSPSPTLTVTDLARGDHDFSARFVPSRSELFADSTSATKTVGISASATATTLDGSAAAQVVTLTAAVDPAVGIAAGTVRFREGSTLVATGTVAYGESTISLTGVTPGAHVYTAMFVPSDLERYVGSTSTSESVTVPAYPAAESTTTTLTGQVLGRTASLVATVSAAGATPAGTVQIKDGSSVVDSVTLSAGSASLTLGDLTKGSHDLTATFVPADSAPFEASTSAETSLEVDATPTTTALATSLDAGTVTLETSVSPAAAGTVKIKDGASLVGTVTLSGGTGELVLTGVAKGAHHYTATFVPTDDLRQAGSTSPTQDVTIDPAETATVLGSSVSLHQVVLSATVTSASGAAAGTVTFREGGDVVGSDTVSGGVASATVSAVATGSHTYTATFTPTDPVKQAGSVSAGQAATVVATTTTTALTTSVVGQVVTLSGSVTTAAGTLAGKLEFREGSTLVGTLPYASGPVTLQVSDVMPGSHAYVAKFVPSGTTHATSSPPAKTAVAKGSTVTTLQSSFEDHDVTLTAGVTGPGTPAGDVELRDGTGLVGTVPLSSGAASLTLSTVAAGSHSYTATFVPTDAAVHAGSVSVEQVVDVDLIATTTTLTAAASGQSVDLTSTVSAGSGTLTGSVEFREGSTAVGTATLSDGAASVTVDQATPGVHSYTATFVPTGGTHNRSTSPVESATILGTTSTTVTTSVTGRTVTATAAVTSDGGTPTGSVTFYRDGTEATTKTLAAGTAAYTAEVVPGTYNYTATYMPSPSTFRPSSSAASVVTVDEVASVTSLQAAVDDRTVTLDAAVTVTSGSAAGKVQFREGGALVGAVAVATGAASLTLSDVPPGAHTYTASFVPSDPTVYLGSASSAATVTAARIGTTTALLATASAQTVTLAATPATASGRLTGSVEFRDGTTPVGTLTLSDTTVVLALTEVTPGSHTYTATFVPAGTTHAGSTSSERTVTAARHSSATGLTASVDVGTVTLDATVSSGFGTPAGDVVFRDGTTAVGTVAIDEGAAQLVLPLVTPGSHRYTATFEPTAPTTYTDSDSPSRTVSVLPVVTTTDLTATSDGQAVTLGAQVAGASGVPSGSVVFREGGRIVDTVTVVAGAAPSRLQDVVPGSHTYTATFVPTSPALFASSASPGQSTTVDPIATETGLTVEAGASTVLLEADLDSAAGGKIVFREGGTAVGQVTLADQAAALTVANVAPGAHTYTATFVPSDPATYAGSVSAGRSVTVKVPTTTDLRVSAVQRSVSLDATVMGAGTPAGDVEFREGGTVVETVPVASGTATVTLTDVTPGNHSYRATFVPATPGTVADSTSAVRSTTVAPIVTTTVLSTGVDGHSVTLDAGVTRAGGGSPVGMVDFRDGSTLVASTPLLAGAASVTLTDVAPGDHAYRAFFTPTDPVALGFSSTAPRFTTVDPVATGTDLDLTAHGRTVSFETVVTSEYAVPAGSVIIREGSKIVGTLDLDAGAGVFELADVDPGPHTYAATYVPAKGGAHLGSVSPERSVIVAMPTATVVTATAAVRTITLRAVVTPMRGAPDGSVEFREGSDLVGTVVVDHDGAAATTLTAVAPGEHTYIATFVPTDPVTLAGSVSPAGKVTVEPIVTTTTLETEVDVRTVTLSAGVTGASDTPVGQVEFRDGTDVVDTIAVDDGAASTTLTSVTPGEHTYTATFVPTDPVTFARSVSPGGDVTVDPIVTTTALAAHVAVRTVTLSATVTGDSGTPTGQVEFREGSDVVGTAALVAGVASLALTGVTPGAHTYTAAYLPTSAVTYADSVSSDGGTATVDPIVTTTALTATADGRAVTLDAAIGAASDTPTGQVEFREGDDVVGTIDLEAGAASTTLTNVTPGDHVYTATFVATDPVHFAGSDSGDKPVTIGQIVTTTALVAAVSGQSVTLTATPATDDGTLTGAVKFLEGATLLGTVTLGDTTAVLTLPDVTPGQHTYTATFVPSGTAHATSSDHQQVTVPNATTTALTVTADDGRVTLSALVTSDGAGVPTGAVEFYDGDTLLGDPSGVGGDGVAGLTVDDVLGGVHSYRAVFIPDDAENFMTSDKTSPVTVDPTVTTTGVVAERKPDSRSVILTADVSASIGSPIGTVTFRDTTSEATTVVATETVANRKATTTLSSVATGDHDYEATFVPTSTATYAGSGSSQAHLTMAASTTTTEIAVSSQGAIVTVQAEVTSADGVPAGKVQLTQDGEPVPQLGQLVAGESTVTLVDVAPGEHTYAATYLPEDGSFEPSVSSAEAGRATVTIPASATTTSLNAVAVGRTVTLSAAVTSPGRTPNGSVVFSDGRTQLTPVAVAAGSASLTLPGVAVGAHTYSAVFVPANPAAFATSTSPARQVTVAATATTTSLTGSVRGTTANLRVTVAGADGLAPAGTVQVLDGSTALGRVQVVGGQATLTVPGAKVGKHSYRATFVPSTADFSGSSSSLVALTVRPVASRTTLTAPARAKAKSRPTVKVKVRRGSAPAAGKVRLTYGGKKVTLTLKKGRASFKLPKVKKGTVKVTASYLGNATTAKSKAGKRIKVSK